MLLLQKLGHIERFCRLKEKHSNFVEDKGNDETENLFIACYSAHECPKHVWFVDSGCSNHMTGNLDAFISLDKSDTSKVKMGDGNIREAHGKGTVKASSCGLDSIKDVLYVPDLDTSLLSVGQFMMDGYSLVFEDLKCCVYKDKTKKNLLDEIPMAKNKSFPLSLDGSEKHALTVSLLDENWSWHHRYGHLSFKNLKFLFERNMVNGLPSIKYMDKICESCILGKHHQDAFPKHSSWRASNPIELVHADLCGPMQTVSLNSSKYFVVFVDDYRRMTWVYFVKERSDALYVFKKFKSYVEKQSGYSLKTLRPDRGGEFISREFNAFCDENGIRRQLTTSYTP